MTDLTELYRKAELPDGMYYVEYSPIMHEGVAQTNGGIVEKYLCRENWHTPYEEEHILAKVPSYGEYDNILKCYEHAHKQNKELKELLKAANKFLKDYGFSFDGKDCAEAFKLHGKINEVLK